MADLLTPTAQCTRILPGGETQGLCHSRPNIPINKRTEDPTVCHGASWSCGSGVQPLGLDVGPQLWYDCDALRSPSWQRVSVYRDLPKQTE